MQLPGSMITEPDSMSILRSFISPDSLVPTGEPQS